MLTAIGPNEQPSVWKYVRAKKVLFKSALTTFSTSERWNSRTLTKHVWCLNENTTEYSVKCKILEKCKLYLNCNMKWRLCLAEGFQSVSNAQTFIWITGGTCLIFVHVRLVHKVSHDFHTVKSVTKEILESTDHGNCQTKIKYTCECPYRIMSLSFCN